jgi:two-component system response regulator (stage 0 sporulation protein F)
MVGEFLRRRGYQIQTAVNGKQALDLIHAKSPDLVLLDIYMPGINGIEVLRRIQQINPAIGVIMLTASQEEALLQTALDIGAFDVLCKPVNLDQLALAVTVKLAMQA